MKTRQFVAGLLSVATIITAPVCVRAQGGVSVIGVSGADSKPRVIVDSVRGAGGDSIRTIIARDFDNSDRIVTLPPSGTPAVGAPLNYPLFANLGVNNVVEASVLPSGWLHVELHDVGTKLLKQKADFSLPGTPGNPAWASGVARSF